MVSSRRSLPAAPTSGLLPGTRVLPVGFYRRNTLIVAPDLLGKIILVRGGSRGRELAAARIVEVEAYRSDDPASHSARGSTPRASVMFGEPGRAYVYFIYGMYEMLNFVTEPEGEPGAVLIRAVEPVLGEAVMAARRGHPARRTDLTGGPGKLCVALGIDRQHNGMSLQGPALRVLDDGYRPDSISTSPRVGISKAQDKLWRYFITGHPFVSKAPQNRETVLLPPVL